MTSTALAAVCRCKKAHPLSDPTAGGKLCGASTKQEDAKYPTCHRPSGWGTDHPGESKCKLHGGASVIRSGRYSIMRPGRVRDLIAQLETDPDPLNILPELNSARALFVDFIDRYEETTEALLAWHESYEATRVPLPEDKVMAFEHVIDEWEIATREGKAEPTERQLAELQAARAFLGILRGKGMKASETKPRRVLDISDAYRIVGEITKIVERIEKIRAANAISRADLTRVIDQMGKVVMMHVEDTAKLALIRRGWLELGAP